MENVLTICNSSPPPWKHDQAERRALSADRLFYRLPELDSRPLDLEY